MGIKEKLSGTFDSPEEFAQAASDGVKEDISVAISPLQRELNDIKGTLAALGVAVQAAQSTAASAASAAQTAQNSANSAANAAQTAQTTAAGAASAAAAAQQTANQTQQSIPTPTPTPSTSGVPQGPPATPGASSPTTPQGTPAATPQPTITPTPSAPPLVFVLTLPEPIFVGNILAGGTRPTANIITKPLEGGFYVGSEVEFEFTNPDQTVQFDAWYWNTPSGASVKLGATNPFYWRLPREASVNIIAKFIPR